MSACARSGDGLGYPPAVCCEDRRTAGYGLECGEAERLQRAWSNVQVYCSQEISQPLAIPLEGQPEESIAPGAALEPLPGRAVANQHQMGTSAPFHGGPRRQEQVQLLLAGEPADEQSELALGQTEQPACVSGVAPSTRMKPVEVDAQAYSLHSLDSFALELTSNEVGGGEGSVDEMAQPADVAPGQFAGGAANRSSRRRPGGNDPGKVAMVEPDCGDIQIFPGEMHQPWCAPGAADLDEVRTLVSHDAAGRAGSEHEAIWFLGGNRGTVEPVTADPVALVNRVVGAGNDQDLPQIGPRLDIAGLLEQVGPNAAGSLPEEFGNVEDAESVRT